MNLGHHSWEWKWDLRVWKAWSDNSDGEANFQIGQDTKKKVRKLNIEK